MLEGYALLSEMAKAGMIDVPGVNHSWDSLGDQINRLYGFYETTRKKLAAQTLRQEFIARSSHYSAVLGRTFAYEFSQGDLDRINSLLSELRAQITASSLFKDDHRSRLLAKLEKLQAEIHKKMSNLDKFWAILGEAGVVVGKFGIDAKPMFDNMNEVLRIVWRTQARAEDLSSDAPPPLPNTGGADLLEEEKK